MHRSSESIAALASALAKAQAELVNPEKSLIATIRGGRAGEAERSFRYAPLSSGLDIVRKTLGHHEIATVQMTAIDQAAGIVQLTTMLAHASGEWIASDWPVCSIAEMASPQRVGSALTYARRYALFTLVGIAGEDDLDAPDMCATAPSSSASAADRAAKPEFPREPQFPPRTAGNTHARTAAKGETALVLSADQSAALRNRLLAEIAALESRDTAASWARQALSSKNTLTAGDAKLLEDAFEHRLLQFLPFKASQSSDRTYAESPLTRAENTGPTGTPGSNQSKGIDKSVLALGAPRRYRNREHLRYVAQQPCLVCARKPSDAHHLRFVQPRSLGRKASDEFAVPLCRTHHRGVHRAGDERAWWKSAGIDPIQIARKLWKRTRRNEGPDGRTKQGLNSDRPVDSPTVDS
jgi:hypothetical protein